MSGRPKSEGATGLSRAALKADVDRRVRAVQALMKRRDVKAIIAAVAGNPGRTGWMRYFAAVERSVSQAYVLIEQDNIEPLIVLWSPHTAEWIKSTATTSRVESTFSRNVPPIQKAIEVVSDLTGGTGRVGMLSMSDCSFVSSFQAFHDALPALDAVDMTDEVNAIRQIKSPFEIAALRDMGRLLCEGLEMFAECARPGRLKLDVAAEVEGFLKGRGGLGGRVKYSLGERPYTIPAPPGERFTKDDILVFQFVYLSPLGYWYELSSLYAFKALPRAPAARLEAMEAAILETARIAVPGTTYRMISETSDRVFREHGFKVVGKYTEDCHTIGTEIRDGANITSEEWELKENMVLALHPASLLEGDLGFFLIDTFHVQQGGAVPLSPLAGFCRLLPAP